MLHSVARVFCCLTAERVLKPDSKPNEYCGPFQTFHRYAQFQRFQSLVDSINRQQAVGNSERLEPFDTLRAS